MNKEGKVKPRKGPKKQRGRRKPTQKEKTLRAFGAYLEVLDTAAYLKSWMHGPLAMFDLTMQGFRLLVLLYREGPTAMMKAAQEMRYTRQNLEGVVRRLEQRGWVSRENVRVDRAAENARAGRKAAPFRGNSAWRMAIIRLTPAGEKFVAQVFPRQAKVAKALMRALDGREQESLREICRKLRAGHILKFLSEIEHVDEWDEGMYAEEEGAQREGEYGDLLVRRREAQPGSEAGLSEQEAAAPAENEPDRAETAEQVSNPFRRRGSRKAVAPVRESQPWRQPGVKQQPIMTYEIEEWLRWEAEQDKIREAEYKREHPEYRD